MTENVFCDVTVTSDHQNQIISSLSQSGLKDLKWIFHPAGLVKIPNRCNFFKIISKKDKIMTSSYLVL